MMNWALVLCLLFTSVHAVNSEVEDFISTLPQASTEEARAFLETPTHDASEQPKKCSVMSSSLPGALPSAQHNGKLLLFVSFSLPMESWKEYSPFLEKVGGSFILRGLPGNSFSVLSKKIIELRKEGIQAEILLDPESFEKYAITAIPTLVLDNGKQYDKISGNITPTVSLACFTNSGHTKNLAKQLLKQAEAY